MAVSVDQRWQLGSATQPVRIFANLDDTSLGDFVSSLFVVNSIANRFDHREVTVLYRNNRDFKAPMMRLLRPERAVEVPADVGHPSIDIVNPCTPIISDPAFKPWFDEGLNAQDVFVTGAMAEAGYLWTFDRLHHLSFMPKDEEMCGRELIARGVNPDRWLCTFHAREPGYDHKPNVANFRDCNPHDFWQAILHVVRVLGGQVVRLGHPAMTPFPTTDGVIDLSRESNSAFLQAFAISRSRFFFGGPSGPTSIADALNIPNGIANASNYHAFNEGCVLRTVDLYDPNGKVIRQKELFDAGYCKLRMMEAMAVGFTVVQNSPAELSRLANFLYDMTDGITGWRETPAPILAPRPNNFTWPPGPPRPRGQFLPV